MLDNLKRETSTYNKRSPGSDQNWLIQLFNAGHFEKGDFHVKRSQSAPTNIRTTNVRMTKIRKVQPQNDKRRKLPRFGASDVCSLGHLSLLMFVVLSFLF